MLQLHTQFLRQILTKGRILYSQKAARSLHVLAIETSCDDTGVAIVNSDGKVLGQSLHSQQNFHLKYGGIIPPRAQDLHRENIEKGVAECLERSGMDVSSVDAIAVTNRPGLPMSLLIGVRYAKYLARKFSKPIVPIHHMEAHALAVRLDTKVPFPYLCLLISGGHSQLVLIKSPTELFLLGSALDDAPGEAFDKVARKLRLGLVPQLQNMSGGQAIETAARGATNSSRFEFPLPLARNKDCNFSFAGLKNNAFRTLRREENNNSVRPDEVIPHYEDFCAGFLKASTRHLSNRTQRAIEFCLQKDFFPADNRSLVISGGVACNDYIFDSLSNMAQTYNFQTFRPAKQYCSDNGVMIAWNGVERIHADPSCLQHDFDQIEPIGKCSLGESLVGQVTDAGINCKWVKVKEI